MTKFTANIFFLLLYLFPCQTVFAQKTEISGMVADSVTLKSMEGVVVKVLDGKKIIVFGTTNNSGEYKLSFESLLKKVDISFQVISHKTQLITLNNKSQIQNVLLNVKSTGLREVTVQAPIVSVKKDTISFNVASFKSAADFSIEDVIKKLPGVEVAKDGKIAYQGKDISRFNIEGLDMLGGKYTLASRNIQAKDVSRVEVNENYQEVKQLQGKEYSDKVAMNLKLTKESKMKLIGSLELGGGYREKEGLYTGALTAMAFGKKAQFIGTLKANNFGAPLTNNAIDHFGGNNIYNVADRLIGSDLVASASLPYSRYREKNDILSSLNSVLKLTADKTLRVNLDYNRDQNNYQYETNSKYSLNNNSVEIVEQQSPKYLINNMSANVDYLINSSKIYLDNNIYITMRDVDNHFDLTSNGIKIQQLKTSRLFGLKNKFSVLKKTKKMQYDFNSIINYSNLPKNKLTFLEVPGITSDYFQISEGESFYTKEAVTFGYDLGKITKLSVVADVRMDYDKIHTQLLRNDSTTLNQNDGYKIVTSIWPEYRFLSTNQRYGFTIGLPINMYNLGFKNRINHEKDFYFNRPFFNSWLKAHYVFSTFAKMEIYTGINNSIGDINDFIVNPIQTSYQNKLAKTGILAANRNLTSSVNLEYKNPLKLFFANGTVSYSSEMRNVLNNQVISVGNSNIEINSSGVSDYNYFQKGSIAGKVSKNLRDVSTNISLGANCAVSSGKQMRQGIKINVNSNSFSIAPSVRKQIAKWLEIMYSMTYSQSTITSINISSTYHQQSHNLNLSYNPTTEIVIYSNIEFSKSEIIPNTYKSMQFLDAGVRYKFRKLETALQMNNLFNTKAYSYTLISNLDRFSYNYYLNPREVVLNCKFNL